MIPHQLEFLCCAHAFTEKPASGSDVSPRMVQKFLQKPEALKKFCSCSSRVGEGGGYELEGYIRCSTCLPAASLARPCTLG